MENFINKMGQVEERISSLMQGNRIRRLQHRSVKSKKIRNRLCRNQNTIKRNLLIIGTEKGEGTQVKGIENISNKIIEETLSSKEKYANQIARGIQYTKQKGTEKKFPCHIVFKTLHVQNSEKILKAAKEKDQISQKGRPVRIMYGLSLQTLDVRSDWTDVLYFLKVQRYQPWTTT